MNGIVNLENLNKSKHKGTLPVVLLTENKKAIVAGGGKVALRKVGHLVDAKMEVLVIAPDITSEIISNFKDSNVSFKNKEVEKSDINDAYIVVAATSDRVVNRRIINWCKEAGINCNCSDGNWTEGDFITPAIYRDDTITFTVSTEGKACRKSRLIKDTISRHIKTVESADLYVIGTDYSVLPTFKREKLHLDENSLNELGEMVMEIWGIHEFIIMNTCNRVELYALASQGSSFEKILKNLMCFNSLSETEFYIYRGFEAFEHLTKLATGLKSQLKGEYHIVSQVKSAFSVGFENGWANGAMKEWCDTALHVSKLLRNLSTTNISTSIEKIAIDFTYNELGGRDLNIAIVGTGVVGSNLLKIALLKFPQAKFKFVYHKNEPNLTDDQRLRVNVYSMERLNEILIDVDCVFAATSSKEPVLNNSHFSDNMKQSILCIDCSVPYAIDKTISENSAIELVDMDELNNWNEEQHVHEIGNEKVNNILNNNRNLYEKIVKSFKDRDTVQ